MNRLEEFYNQSTERLAKFFQTRKDCYPLPCYDADVHKFLEKRQLDAYICRCYGLGLGTAPDEAVVDDLVGYSSRLLFPLYNTSGTSLLGLTGRAIVDYGPKFYNTPGYKKQYNLWPIAYHQYSLTTGKTAILVESFFDVLTLAKAALPIGVAMMGSSLSTEQASILSRYVSKVIYVPHFDKQNMADVAKIVDKLDTFDIAVTVALIPTIPFVTDLDELQRYNPQDFIHWTQQLMQYNSTKEGLREWEAIRNSRYQQN